MARGHLRAATGVRPLATGHRRHRPPARGHRPPSTPATVDTGHWLRVALRTDVALLSVTALPVTGIPLCRHGGRCPVHLQWARPTGRQRGERLLQAHPGRGTLPCECTATPPVCASGPPFDHRPARLHHAARAESTIVRLKSKQEDLFEVEKEVAFLSVTVKNMVEETDLDTPVPLPMVVSEILVKARAWLAFPPAPCVTASRSLSPPVLAVIGAATPRSVPSR